MRAKYHSDPEWRAAKKTLTRQYHLDNPDWSRERQRASHELHAVERYARAVARGSDPQVVSQRRESARRSEQRRRAIKAEAEVSEISAKDLTELLAATGN